MNSAFVTVYTGAHVKQIVLARLDIIGIVALKLKLGSLEIVARVVFV